MALQLRRGTNQERLGITLVEGEMVYVTDHTLTTISVTGLDASTNVLTTTLTHGLTVGDQIKYIGSTRNGVTASTVYYVKTVPSTTTFTLSTTSGGTTLDITGTYSADLEFATGPTTAAGAPLGYSVSPLWAGDGLTIGGVAAGSTLLTDLLDVTVGVYGNVGQYGEVLADNNVIQYNNTSGQWENRANLTLNGRLYQTGQYLKIDTDAAGGDSFITFANDAAQIKYDVTDDRFELNKDLVANGLQGGNVKIGMTADNVINIGGDHLYLQTDSTSYKVNLNTGLVAAGDIETTGNTLTLNSDTSAGNTVINLNGSGTAITYNASSGYVEMPNIARGNTLITSGTISTSAGNLTVSSAGNITLNATGTVYVSDPLEVTGTIDATGVISTSATSMEINSASAASDSYLYFKGSEQYIKWNNSLDGFLISNDTTIGGALRINENSIYNSSTQLVISWSGKDVTLAEDLTVVGNATVDGDLTVGGNDIKSNGGTTAITLSGADATIAGSLTVTGDLTVSGTTTTLDTQNLLVEDNIILLNKNEVGAGVTAGSAGIEIERGSLTNATWLWDETNDWWASSGDLWAAGNIIAGTYLATNGDNIYFNNEDGGSGATSTIHVKRGTNADVALRWNETSDRWETTVDGSTYIALPNQALDTTSNPTFAGLTAGNIQVGLTSNTLVDTTTGNLQLTAAATFDVEVQTDFVVDAGNGTLKVDYTNQRVGVNTLSPAYPLDVDGVINTNSTVQCADVIIDSSATLNTQTTTTTSTSATVISSTTRTTQKVVITITDNVSTEMHVLEALAFMKGTSAYLTTYGEMYSNTALASFTADVSAGAIRILATPASTNSTTFTVARISVD